MKHLHIVATFEFAPEDEKKALKLLESHVESTLKEEGCLKFDIIEDKERDTFFFLTEIWESDEMHQQHESSTRMKEFLANINEIMVSQIIYMGYNKFN